MIFNVKQGCCSSFEKLINGKFERKFVIPFSALTLISALHMLLRRMR